MNSKSMSRHLQHYDSVDAFLDASPQDRPLVASMPDGNGSMVFFRTEDGNETYLSQGQAPFRIGVSPLGGEAVLSKGE